MKSFTATFRFNTPALAHGPDTDTAELRVPAIIGMLRFWFRFLHGQQYLNDIPALLARESLLFGDTDRNPRGCLSIRILSSPAVLCAQQATERVFPAGVPQGAAYLGFGAIADKAFARGVLAHDQEFRLRFDFRRRATAERIQDFMRTLWLWTHFGGLGGRSRRGWGSIQLLALDPPDPHHDLVLDERLEFVDGALEHVRGWMRTPSSFASAGTLPAFTHLADCTRAKLVRSSGNRSAMQAMTSVGRALLEFRRGSDPANAADTKSLKALLRAPLTSTGSVSDARAAFGLPHNYYFRDQLHQTEQGKPIPTKVDVTAAMSSDSDKALKRRASPLFLHVHRTREPGAEPEFHMMCMLAPAELLPDGYVVLAKAHDGDKALDYGGSGTHGTTSIAPVETFWNSLK